MTEKFAVHVTPLPNEEDIFSHHKTSNLWCEAFIVEVNIFDKDFEPLEADDNFVVFEDDISVEYGRDNTVCVIVLYSLTMELKHKPAYDHSAAPVA